MDNEITPLVAADYRPKSSVTSVIPTLNEARNIQWVLNRLPECIDELIVVDGRSTDDTVAVVRETRPDARIILEHKPGKGAALRAGFAEARGELIVMLDADGSMDPCEIRRYVHPLEHGYDLVKGSRFLKLGGTTDISRVRALGNLGLLTVVNGLYNCRFTELCYGFMAFRREVLDRLRLDATGFEIETQIVVHALRAGLNIGEVPSFEAERRFGQSNLRATRDGARALRSLLAARVARWPGDERAGEPRPKRPRLGREELLRRQAVAERNRAAVSSH